MSSGDMQRYYPTQGDEGTCFGRHLRPVSTFPSSPFCSTHICYQRYDELSTRSVLSNIPNFRHCLRPGCESGQIHDSGAEGNIFRCNACDFLVCTTHDEAFHMGETCEEYDRRKSHRHQGENDASIKKIKKMAKRCPGEDCGVWIEKNNGCDHMTCKFGNEILFY
jgi:hypothetical protein